MSEEILRRELLEARAREEEYRARLERSAALASRLHAHTATLRELLRGEPGRARSRSALAEIAIVSGKALGVRRTGIWLFDDGRDNLVNMLQVVDGEIVAGGVSIEARTIPEYVRAISGGEVLAIEDVLADARTRGLAAYARDHDVRALLDIAISVPGEISGVVCHEHVGAPRRWAPEEIDFAANVGAIVGLALEADRRIEAERSAAGLEARYRHLVESLPVTVYSFDVRTGTLEYLSPRVEALGGWSPARWLEAGGHRAWIDAVHPEDRPLVEDRFAAGLARPISPEIVYRVRAGDGVERWVRDTCRVVRDHAGVAFSVQGVLADITAQRAAEIANEESARRFRSLLENAALVAVVLDARGRIELANDSLARLTGKRASELVGADWFDEVLAPERREAARAAFEAEVRSGELSVRHEDTLHSASGPRRFIWSHTALRGPSGAIEGRASLGLDVTERARRERESLDAEKTESLGRLAASVAHDFNNLLTVITTGLDAIELSAEPSHASGAARDMRVAVEEAASLTRTLLGYARREPLEAEPVVLDAVIDETQPILESLVGGALGLELELGAPSARVFVPRTYLRQLVINLVTNAADATRGKGTTIRVTTCRRRLDHDDALRLRLEPSRPYVMLTVADDGRGIPPDVLPHVFEPFFTTKGEGKGTGIGLASSLRTVVRAEGQIDVESQVGRGSTFRVYLPEHDGDPATAWTSPPQASPVQTVLVVEDYGSLRKQLVAALAAAGYSAVGAADLNEAYAVLDRRSVDLLLTDDSLPDGSGRAFAPKARGLRPDLRAILLTGREPDEAHGFDAVLEKPASPEDVVAVVRRLIGEPTAKR